MKVLFIGGTGFISTAVSRLTLEKGLALYHLNRGQRKNKLTGVKSLVADIHQPAAVQAVLNDMQFDLENILAP